MSDGVKWVDEPSGPALHCRDLSFSYPGGSTVFEQITMAVTGRRCIGLLGANGAGKSTFLGAITNSIKGTTGGESAIVGGLGYATQDVALYRHLTVAENLRHSARFLRRTWNVDQLVDDTIAEYHLDDIAGTKVQRLSGGQQRLAHLANAFVHEPGVRLLDEPTTSLDFQTRRHLVEVVRSWREVDIACVVTAHYPEDIEDLCTDLVVLHEGRLHLLGDLQHYLESTPRIGAVEFQRHGEPNQRTAFGSGVQTVGDLQQAVSELGAHDSILQRLELRQPRLRDLLQEDPSLASIVNEDMRP